MAAPPIPPIRLELIGTGLAVEKQHRSALRGLADRATLPARDDLRHVRALVDGGAIGRVHHIARIRLLRGDIGNHTASYPEIPVPPEPNDMRLYGTEGVLAGSTSASFAA